MAAVLDGRYFRFRFIRLHAVSQARICFCVARSAHLARNAWA